MYQIPESNVYEMNVMVVDASAGAVPPSQELPPDATFEE